MNTERIVVLKESEKITLHELCAEFVGLICDYVELHRHLQEINQLFEVFQFNLERLHLSVDAAFQKLASR